MKKQITLPYKFTLREYQVEPWNAIMHEDFQRGTLVVPRRNGKDLLCWNTCIAKAMERVGLYFYMAPYYNQVRQIIWEGYDKSGRRFLDYIPKEILKNKTKLDMKIDLVNGSQIKLQGSDNIDRIVGTNPRGIVFTEFSLHKVEAWDYLRPVLAENDGWAVFNGTPRGLNHFYDLYKQANKDDEWYTQFLTRDDTNIPSLEAIQKDRDSGMPEVMIQQEYYCSFLSGVVGSYYADYINTIRGMGHITRVPYDPRLRVHTAWDIGINDSTAIWFAQLHGKEIRLIDYYENNNLSMKDYLRILQKKPYLYGDHYVPHDMEVREYSDGKTRVEKAADLGYDLIVTPRHGVEDSHDLVRDLLPRCWFDSAATVDGMPALMAYQQKYNERTGYYSDQPMRNWAKHGADAFKTLAHNIENIEDGGRPMRPRVNRSLSYTKPHVNRSMVNTL